MHSSRIRNNLAIYVGTWLSTLLKECHAYVAGDSLVYAYHNIVPIHHLHIYVHYSNAWTLLQHIFNTGFLEMKDSGTDFPYTQEMIRMQFETPDHIRCTVVIISDKVASMKDVVERFDLTFCQLWWDGDNVFCDDWDALDYKTGYLNPHCVASLLVNLSWKLVNRIHKFRLEGFTIQYTSNPFVPVKELLELKSQKEVRTTENTIVSSFLDVIMHWWMNTSTNDETIESKRISAFFLTHPAEYNLGSLYEKWCHDSSSASFFEMSVRRVREETECFWEHQCPGFADSFSDCFRNFVANVDIPLSSHERFEWLRQFSEWIVSTPQVYPHAW